MRHQMIEAAPCQETEYHCWPSVGEESGLSGKLQLEEDEPHVEVEREGRDEVQGASGSGDEGSREVASAHDRYFRVPASNTPPRDR